MNKSALKKFADIGRSRKIFINHMNSWFSNFVIEELRTEAVSDPKIIKNEFMGTKNNTNMKLPYLFEPTEIKIDNNPHYEQDVFKCDVFIYNLEDADLNEIEYIIKGLKSLKHQTEKTLVIVTSIMTWARTPPKILKETVSVLTQNEVNDKQAAEENLNFEETNHKVNSDFKKSSNKNNRPAIPFEDSDYALRLPAKKYYQYKVIETIALTASNVNPMLKTYIICPGLIYGCGEQIFYDYFKMAWMNEPARLPIIGDGKNSIPTIHIKDLASLVKRVVERTPEEKYIFAIDRTKNSSVSNLIESVSKSLGNGSVEHIKDYSLIIKIPVYNFLSIDIKCKTSKLFEDRRGEHEDKEDFLAKKFRWHCEFGIPENSEKLRKEFNLYRNLKPVKIFIIGPPVSGKSTLSHLLSQYYDLQVYNIKDLIEWAKSLPGDDQLGQEINTKIEELKDKLIFEYEEAQKKLKVKKKIEPLERNSLNPRIPEELVVKIFKRLLNNNLCRNKGYILDGYPKSFNDCQEIFCKIDIEKSDSEGSKYQLDLEICPNNVIRLDMATDEYLKSRIKSNNELIQTNPHHYSEEGLNRRLNNFKNLNEAGKINKTLGSFFVDNNVEILSLDSKLDSYSLFAEAKRNIESKGKIKKFAKNDESKENNLKLNFVEKSEIENSRDITLGKE